MMGNWAGWGGFGMGFGWFFMVLFWAFLIFAVVAVARWLIATGSGASGPGASRALETLKQRYARGEIDREEYEQKKRDLA